MVFYVALSGLAEPLVGLSTQGRPTLRVGARLGWHILPFQGKKSQGVRSPDVSGRSATLGYLDAMAA